ncbi:hypothetical protein [Cupriavidus metallidurans]|uniref:hypothetical protein n=1 Tax=Cupriavidus metallidurans TaxID=119219 RepID=UPI00068EDA6A|nr:hypothetical protein [Cupriavidus metallidurans]MDE4920639.1 hypothetical protein [Cupriavidus metallidurans]
MLAPLENMLRHIRRGGELDVDESDTLIYACSATGSHYDVIGLVQAFAETFAKQRQCDPKAPAVDRLHELIASINGDTVTEAMVDAGLACVASIRAYMAANPLGNIREAALSVSRAA